MTKRGLFSELNSLHGFYNSTTPNDLIHIDGSFSQYFKNISISNVFELNKRFCKKHEYGSIKVSSSQWTHSALRRTPINFNGIEIFKLSNAASIDVNTLLNSIGLPETYYCFHIRRGDKIGNQHRIKNGKLHSFLRGPEANRYEIDEYFKSAEFKCTETQAAIFIMTDDYKSIIEDINQLIIIYR